MHKKQLLIDYLIIIGIIVLLLGIIYFALNPWKLMAKNRDYQRQSDVESIAAAINLYLADGKDFSGVTGPYKSTDSGDWLPIDFSKISSGSPLSKIPIDPKNNTNYHYIIGLNPKNKTYEINCSFEESDNINKQANDNGNSTKHYEVGTDLTILSDSDY